MNHFQLLQTLLAGDYTQDDIVSMVILKYRQLVGVSISRSAVIHRLSQPIREWKHFTAHFIDTLTAIVGEDIRIIFNESLKEKITV